MDKMNILQIVSLTFVSVINICSCYKLQEEWRWIDSRVIPSIYDINDKLNNRLNNEYRPSYQRLVSEDRSNVDLRPFYGRSNSYGTSHMQWKWKEREDSKEFFRKSDERDVVIHMKKKLKKNSRLASSGRYLYNFCNEFNSLSGLGGHWIS